MERMLTMVKNNTYKLGCYEKAMPNSLTIKEKLLHAKKAGFDFLEISIDETDDKLNRLDYSDQTINQIIQDITEIDFPILTMCLSGHRKYPLGSHDLETQAKSLEIMEKACIFAQKIGVRIIQLAGYDVYYEKHDNYTQESFEINLQKCVDIASKYGILLGFETMETAFMDTVQKSMKYVSSINSPYLNVYPDIGNLTNASRIYQIPIEDDLESGKGKIVAAHLKEIIEGHYREIPFGKGDTLYDEAIGMLKSLNVRIFTGEFWYIGNKEWENDLEFANQYLRDKLSRYY
jgi:L-ribulose-5-phosphate 3-epimerase